MKISICCITYNHEEYISDALESFLMQELDFDYEIIVSDDHSTDKTPEILKYFKEKYPQTIRLILREKNVGIYENFLGVLEEAKGEFIAYCDGDDYWIDPNKLKTQIEALDNNSSCSFSCHDVIHVSEKGEYLSLMSKGRRNENWKNGIYPCESIITSPLQIPHANSILMRRVSVDLKMLRSIGPFTMGDYMLTCSLAFSGETYYLEKPMSAYRDVRNSLKRQTSRTTLKKLKKQLIENHFLMNDYYHQKYKKQLFEHLFGKLMLMEKEKYYSSIKEKKWIYALISIYYAFLYRRQSGHTYRDIFYLLKLLIKSFPTNKSPEF